MSTPSIIKLITIDALSPYEHNWMIKARVSYKSKIKEIKSGNRDMRILRIDFVDTSGEISCSCFGDLADTFYELVKEGEVYTVMGAVVKVDKKKYSSIPNDRTMTLRKESKIELVEDEGTIPYCRYYFSDVSQVQVLPNYEFIDFVGVVRDGGQVVTVGARGTRKKDVVLIDDSGHDPISLTLWGDDTDQEFNPETLVVLKNVKVKDYNGQKSLNWDDSSRYQVLDLDYIYIPKAESLWNWYTSENTVLEKVSKVNYTQKSSSAKILKTIQQAINEDLGRDKSEYFHMHGTITFAQYQNKATKKPDNWYYRSCVNGTCMKKVVPENDNYFCPKCTKSFDSFKPRYMMTFSIADHTGSIFLRAFSAAQDIIGRDCEELYNSVETGNENINIVFTDIKYKQFEFNIKAERYQDNPNIQYSIQSAKPINLQSTTQNLASTIEAYTKDKY